MLSFPAMLFPAQRLSFATEQLSCYVSNTMAGLLNATFGNAPELILCGECAVIVTRPDRDVW